MPLSYWQERMPGLYREKIYNHFRTKNMRNLHFLGLSPGRKIRTGDFSARDIVSGILYSVLYVGKTDNTERNGIQSLQCLKNWGWGKFSVRPFTKTFSGWFNCEAGLFLHKFNEEKNVPKSKILKPLMLNVNQNPKILVSPQSFLCPSCSWGL